MQIEAVAKIKPVVDANGMKVATNQIEKKTKGSIEKAFSPLEKLVKRITYSYLATKALQGLNAVIQTGDVVVDQFQRMSDLMDNISTQANSFKIAPTQFMALTNALNQLGIGVGNPQEIVKLLENIRTKSIEGETIDVFNRSTNQYEQIAISSLGSNILEQLFRLVEIMQARLPDESDNAYTERLQKSVEFIAGGKLGKTGGAAELKDTDLRALTQSYLSSIGGEGKRGRIDTAINKAGSENKAIIRANNLNQTQEIVNFATTSSSNLPVILDRINKIAEKNEKTYMQDLKAINSSVELSNAFSDLTIQANSLKNTLIDYFGEVARESGSSSRSPVISPFLQAIINKIKPSNENEIYKNSQGKK